MLRQFIGVLCALLLVTASVAPAATATPVAQSTDTAIRFQDELGAEEGAAAEVVSADAIIEAVIADVMPEEWVAEGAITGADVPEEPVAAVIAAEGVPVEGVVAEGEVPDLATAEGSASVDPAAAEILTDESIAAEPPAVETGQQPLAENEFYAFTMPGLTPDNLTGTVLSDIDAFWAGEFAARGRDYYAAATVPVTEPMYSSCGTFGPYDNPAAYCPLDDTVYYSVPLGQDIQNSIGDFAWITVLAHEWGHHVQVVLGSTPEQSFEREQQADCMAGAYAQRAQQQGFLQEGDVSEGVVMAMLSGDPVGLDEMAAGAHGSGDARLIAFMEGYFNGSTACITM